MKWHYNLLIGVINGLEEIFLLNKPAIKVVDKLIDENKKWGARDRKFVSSTIFDTVRWIRKYGYCSNIKELATRKNLWDILGTAIVLKGQIIPNLMEFSNINSKEILKNESEIINNRKINESIPDWLDQIGINDFGESLWNKEVSAFNTRSSLVLRCNTLKTNIKELKNLLKVENIDTVLKKEYPDALFVKEHKKVINLNSYKLGLFEIQDANSQKVATSCNLKPGMTIIDACAGAGGKSIHMASIIKNEGEIIALDPHDSKLKELEKRAKRNGVKIIKTLNTFKSKNISNLIGKADRVLIDAPCSGLGVLKRNPDAKWKMNPEKIKKLINTQQYLINFWSKYIKPGGELIYATCSIFHQENKEQIKIFLDNKVGKKFIIKNEKTYFSHTTGFDGFYIVQLKKNCE
ncbi:MAG: 16S rRNA (cytosine967-C5)-methyltransferase [Candidatus Marivariicella framensis]|jgi:16S rRNA (cytosine967-C5)-methyltransferase|tara:strand:+ start:91 stop:1308 length:1218 start_codon:yes stop_codon:yes gene_type:complete